MAVNVIKFSQFAPASLSQSNNQSVGFGGGVNYKTPFVSSWTTAGRPTPYNGLLGFNTDLTQYEYWNGAAWIQIAAGGSGTVNLGAANQIAFYAVTGTAVSGLTGGNNRVLITGPTGIPSMATALPASFNIPTPNIIGVTDGSDAAAGSVGEFMSSVVAFGSAVALANNVAANVTSITLTAGDWDVWGNVAVIGNSNNLAAANGWISTTSATLPDPSIDMGFSGAAAFSAVNCPVPAFRFNVTVNTIVYLSARAFYPVSGSATGCGGIYARRRR